MDKERNEKKYNREWKLIPSSEKDEFYYLNFLIDLCACYCPLDGVANEKSTFGTQMDKSIFSLKS